MTPKAITWPPKPGIKRNLEAAFSAQIAEYLACVLPADAFATVFPAGGGGKARGAQLKRMGMLAGVPDWLVIWQGKSLFFELKAPGGRLSAQQIETHALLRCAGAFVTTVYRLEAVEGALRGFGVPLRGTTRTVAA